MSPALIGLLGVIAGGLLGGAVSYRVARRQRRDQATTAGRLIALELRSAATRLESAAGKLWPGRLPDERWQKHASDLIGFLPREPRRKQPLTTGAVHALPGGAPPDQSAAEEVGDEEPAQPQQRTPVSLASKLLDAYAIIDIWNAAAAQTPAHGPVGERGNVKEDAMRLARVAEELSNWVAQPQPGRTIVRLAAVLASVVALVVTVIALAVERPVATTESVADAIAAGIPGQQTVVCLDQPGDAWDCTAQDIVLEASGTTCGASLRRPPARVSGRELASAASGCRPRGQPKRYQAAQKDDRVVAVPIALPGEPAELGPRRESIDSPLDEEPWYSWALDFLLDRS